MSRRATKQGAAVEAALASDTTFRSAQELHAGLTVDGRPVGLATVYRQLNSLVEDGRADVVQGPDGESRYRLCGPTEADSHHHHLVCRVCGASVEVASPAVEKWASQIAEDAGYTQVSHTVEIFGQCPRCS